MSQNQSGHDNSDAEDDFNTAEKVPRGYVVMRRDRCIKRLEQ